MHKHLNTQLHLGPIYSQQSTYWLVWGYRRKPEKPEETHADIRRTCSEICDGDWTRDHKPLRQQSYLSWLWWLWMQCLPWKHWKGIQPGLDGSQSQRFIHTLIHTVIKKTPRGDKRKKLWGETKSKGNLLLGDRWIEDYKSLLFFNCMLSSKQCYVF